MKIKNLTPHEVNLCLEKETLSFPPSGIVARVAATTVADGWFGNIPITTTAYGEVQDLPAPEADTIYIVSALVAQRVPDRKDVFIPNEAVRDEKGRIIGCRSLGRV